MSDKRVVMSKEDYDFLSRLSPHLFIPFFVFLLFLEHTNKYLDSNTSVFWPVFSFIILMCWVFMAVEFYKTKKRIDNDNA